VDPTTEALLFALLGAVLGAGVTLGWRISDRQLRSHPPPPEPALPAGIATVLSTLRSSALVVVENDEVLKASAPAYAMGLVAGSEVTVPELADLVRRVRRDGQIRETELVIPRGRRPALHVSARVAPLGSRVVLALLEDRTRERRVEAIRRDFVANVSHELKTPVGALNLLAEAVQEASDDPEAVTRFAARMRTESARLSRLVQQIIELSRLQADDPLEEPVPVAVDELLAAVVDRCAIDAEAKGVAISVDAPPGLEVLGNADEIALALGNLLSNAVTYSESDGRVEITATVPGAPDGAAADPAADTVELSVTDHGVGIEPGEVERIFERFYRVDPARHRSTGGTGLGLSIVKLVAASHGGEARVSSEPGEGSTFTLVLPRRPSAGPPPSYAPTVEAP
jgi:two-component system sensor histidine kinase SenX3